MTAIHEIIGDAIIEPNHRDKPAMLVRCGMKWHIVAVEVGQEPYPANHNWWEIQFCEGFQNHKLFAAGERFSMEDGSEFDRPAR